MKSTRILFLNRSFWPDIGATGQFLAELCEDLSDAHDITFIAGPADGIGRVRRPWARESFGRVSVVRTWGTRLPKKRLGFRLTNLASYYLLAASAAFWQGPPEIVVAETDPPLLGALGALLKRRWGCRLVFNVRDLYPDIAIANQGVKSRFLLELLERSNRFAFESADRIVVLGQDMAQRVIAKRVAAERVVVVPDWVDCEQIRPLESNSFRTNFGDKFVVMYSGNLGLSQQLETVLDAADHLRDDPRVVFVFIGDGARKEALIARARALALPNTLFLPYCPKSNLAASLSAADLHLVPQLSGTAGCMVPSKIYGILGVGRPFVAITDEDAEIARLARDYSVGFVIPPGNAPALAEAVRGAFKSPARLKVMGQRARRLAIDQFDRKRVTRRFAEVLEELADAPVQSPGAY